MSVRPGEPDANDCQPAEQRVEPAPAAAHLAVTSIGTVAAELGLSVEALRYYERAGLCAPARDSGGRRVYSSFDVEQLRLVTALRAVGIPIEAIRQLLAAKKPGADPRLTAQRALRQLTEIDAMLQARQAELLAASSLVRGWRTEIDGWLRALVTAGQTAHVPAKEVSGVRHA